RRYFESIRDNNGNQKYKFTKAGDIFLIDISDINEGSTSFVKCVCDRCNKIYNTKFYQANKSKNNYCSKECMNNPQTYNCDNCGKEKVIKYYRKKALLEGRQKHFFCSRKCQGEWQSQYKKGKNNPRYNRHEVRCGYCNKRYTIPTNQLGRNKYCSVECRQKSSRNKIELECDYCGKKIYKTPSQLKKTKNHFCSHKCADTYRSERAYEIRKCECC